MASPGRVSIAAVANLAATYGVPQGGTILHTVENFGVTLAARNADINDLQRQILMAKMAGVTATFLTTLAGIYFSSAWDSTLQFLGLQEVPVYPLNNPPPVSCDIPVDNGCSQALEQCRGDLTHNKELLQKCKEIGKQFQTQRNAAADDWKACLDKLSQYEKGAISQQG